MKKQYLFVSLTLNLIFFSYSAFANKTVTLSFGVSTNQILDWEQNFRSGVECKEMVDLPATYLCLVSSDLELTQLMGRVSYFVEGHAGRVIVPESDEIYRSSDQANYGGHDIMKIDYEEFYNEMDIACGVSVDLCPNDLEKDLRQLVIGDAIKKNYTNYVVISGVAHTGYLSEVVSHEILHARFFLNPEYQNAIERFWNSELTDEDRNNITYSLSQIYNFNGANGKLLLLNEFQAYLLQENAMYGPIGMLAMSYGEALKRSLQKNGLLP